MRIDHDLAFLLRFENVAWYEDGKVRILDRRIYPMETQFVICHTHQEVAQAIADMVTQSGGPYLAASMGMTLAAYEAKDFPEQEYLLFMEQAADTLSHARPTTSTRMEQITKGALAVAKGYVDSRQGLIEAMRSYALEGITQRYERIEKMAVFLGEQIPKGGTVMTQCFAETIVGMLVRELEKTGKSNVKFITPETRPYLQGGRLTASVIHDMGYQVHIITDNMPGYIMKAKNVDLFTSAADMITLDGHVVNKIGTFQIATMANYHGIPYFVTGTPNSGHPDLSNVIIEEREPKEVTSFLEKRYAMEGISSYYPAFDITPPHLVSGVVTAKGIFSAFDLKSYFR